MILVCHRGRLLRPVRLSQIGRRFRQQRARLLQGAAVSNQKSGAILLFLGACYSEMKMCLAPCFAGCTKEDYDIEGKVGQFLTPAEARYATHWSRNAKPRVNNSTSSAPQRCTRKSKSWDDALRGSPELPRRIQDLNR